MLRVKIELVSYGNEDKARTLQTLTITNVGGTKEWGEYECELTSDEIGRACKVYDWPRQEKDAAALVAEALKRMGY